MQVFYFLCLEAKKVTKKIQGGAIAPRARRAAAQQAFTPVGCTVILLIIQELLILTTGACQLTSFYPLYSIILQALYSACGI